MYLSVVAILPLLVVAILAGCEVSGSSPTALASPTVSKPFTATVFPKGEAAQPVGVPAIRPTLTGNIPAYTLANAKQYILCHPMPRNLATVGAPPTAGQTCERQSFTIVLLQFSTSEEVSRLLNGEPTGLPTSTLLCFTALSGQFAFPGPSGVVVTYQVGFEVFDGQTGNLLMAGGLTEAIPTPTPAPLG
jgi:hypothetical protein